MAHSVWNWIGVSERLKYQPRNHSSSKIILSNLKVSICFVFARDFIYKHSPSSEGVIVYYLFKNERLIGFETCCVGIISAHGAASSLYYCSSSESESTVKLSVNQWIFLDGYIFGWRSGLSQVGASESSIMVRACSHSEQSALLSEKNIFIFLILYFNYKN
mgnify:FL=1